MKAVCAGTVGYIVCIALVLSAQSSPLPEGEGRDIASRACNTQCHGTAVWATSKHKPDEWKAIVEEMVGLGADVTESDQKILIAYLSKNFGPAVAHSPLR